MVCILTFACSNGVSKVDRKSSSSEVINKAANGSTSKVTETVLNNAEDKSVSFATIKTVSDYA